MKDIPVITIDGPSAVGKGTVTKELAAVLKWHVLDSGALYRVVGFAALKHELPLDNEKVLEDLVKTLDFKIEPSGAALNLVLGGVIINEHIRTQAIGSAASLVSQHPRVRLALLKMQRDFLKPPGLVADGRDMGTVVFPNATLKLFLTASIETRAQRRHKELKLKGVNVNLADIFEEVRLRDERDCQRVVSPLKPAADAIEVKTDDLTIKQVVSKCLSLYNQII